MDGFWSQDYAGLVVALPLLAAAIALGLWGRRRRPRLAIPSIGLAVLVGLVAALMTFGATKTLRTIEFDITLTAVADKVSFGDSKDGVLGIRIAPVLQESKNTGKGIVDDQPHTGKIRNAEGQETEAVVWGKASNWMDYSGTLDGEKVGITILDHPANSKRAHWHVRGYGLFAANPFGRKTFSKTETEDGTTELAKGGKLHFRYLIVIHSGEANEAGVDKLWADFSK